MKKYNLVFFVLTLLICLYQQEGFSQEKIIIKGKIELLSQSKTLFLNTHGGSFKIPIKEDSTFFIELEKTKDMDGAAFIKTDSSTQETIWIEAGEYNINFKEFSQKNQWKLLRIINIKANLNAEIDYANYKYLITRGRRRDDMAARLTFLDSLIKVSPSSRVLPSIFRLDQSFLGDSIIQNLLSKVKISPDDSYNQAVIALIKKTIFRNDIIKKSPYIDLFTMKDNNDKLFSYSDLKDKKIILLDFWASWCGPCRSNHKNLKKLYDTYKGKGFEIVSLSLDDDKQAWLNAISTDKMDWINISDLKAYQTDMAKKYNLSSIPFNFVLDSSGKILGVHLSNYEIEKLLKSL